MSTRILTVRQPWAWLIMHGGKDVENRSWAPNWTGTLVVHAGKAVDETAERDVFWKYGILIPDPMPRGVILGSVELIDIVEDSTSRWAEKGRIHWILKDPRPCSEIPWTGSLGLRSIPDDWQERYG